jgi:SAM-dependent methyltransferase
LLCREYWSCDDNQLQRFFALSGIDCLTVLFGGFMNFEERRFDPQRKDILLSPHRHARWEPQTFLSRFNIHKGQVVLDLGCGPGFWTLPLAEKVGSSGIVWALDVSQAMLDALAGRQPPSHVRLVHSELPMIDLPDKSVDFSWVAFVLHEVTPLDQMARELLRVGQRVAALDWRPDAKGEAGPPRDQRLWPHDVIASLQSAGFGSVAQTWQDDDNFLVEAVL